MITQQIMFAKILLLYLQWHGYRLNVIKLLPHKINQVYTVSPDRSRNTTAHRSRFLLWQTDHLSYSLASTVMMEFSSATEHTNENVLKSKMNGRSHLHTSTVGSDTAIQGGIARWLTRLAYLYIPTVSVSPEKN